MLLLEFLVLGLDARNQVLVVAIPVDLLLELPVELPSVLAVLGVQGLDLRAFLQQLVGQPVDLLLQ